MTGFLSLPVGLHWQSRHGDSSWVLARRRAAVQAAAMAIDWENAVYRAKAHSPFLSLGLERQPQLAELLVQGDGDQALAFARAAGDAAPTLASALRRERMALAVALGIGDLAGAFPLLKVTGELTALADRAMDAAIGEAIRHRVPAAEPAGFVALALGKQGAGELNYSSDIDPILLYDPEILPRRERDDPREAAVRVARRMVQTLAQQTDEGYVFRVDLRLRPASEVSPPAISISAALAHYESSALAWERAAFIKARAAAGDVAAGKEFLAAIRPFVWRRSLDFGAIEEIRRLTAHIRENHGAVREPGPGFDVKRGRGGIREVEFFAQTHQLIHGGRNPAVRVRGTRAALDALAEEGIIAWEVAIMLGESYDRLRQIEHRIQMVDDRQTHDLPASAEAIDSLARLDGLTDGAALLDELKEITARVGAHYDDLLDMGGSGESGPVAPVPHAGSALEARLAELGFPDPGRLAKRVEGWCDGRVRSLRSDASMAAFDAILPALLEALAAAPDPSAAVNRWETLLVSLPTAINLLRLLEARPGLLEQMLRILILAPPLAEELARRAELLDALIDASALDLPGSVQDLAAMMARSDTDRDYQDRLDRIRRVVGETRFALGVQLIEAAHDPLDIASALARVAQAALINCVEAASEEFALAHGHIAGAELLVLGLGRFGGGALTHASDLDIIYLFTGDFDARSDGERPLGATRYFNRLAQRVTAALSVPTAEGALYEVDTRLRPQGNQGPLAVSLESFARYQHNDAWMWEHMALTRARVLAGSPQAQAALDAVLHDVLKTRREPAELKAALLQMRADMAAHKPPAGPLDAKLLRGGLVDVEFLVHFLQLREGVGFHPDMIASITDLARAGFVPETLVKDYQVIARLLIAARLLAPGGKEPPAFACKALAKACGMDSYDLVLQGLGEARVRVGEAWAATFGEELEIMT